jgi:hypothetical protein
MGLDDVEAIAVVEGIDMIAYGHSDLNATPQRGGNSLRLWRDDIHYWQKNPDGPLAPVRTLCQRRPRRTALGRSEHARDRLGIDAERVISRLAAAHDRDFPLQRSKLLDRAPDQLTILE